MNLNKYNPVISLQQKNKTINTLYVPAGVNYYKDSALSVFAGKVSTDTPCTTLNSSVVILYNYNVKYYADAKLSRVRIAAYC